MSEAQTMPLNLAQNAGVDGLVFEYVDRKEVANHTNRTNITDAQDAAAERRNNIEPTLQEITGNGADVFKYRTMESINSVA